MRRISDIFEDGDYYITPPLGHAGPVAIAAGLDNARLVTASPRMVALIQRFHDFAHSNPRFFYPLGSLQEIEQILAEVHATRAQGGPDHG